MELTRDFGATAGNGLIPFRSHQADDLLSALGIDEPAQIRLEAIAQFCGVTIVYEPLEGSEARIIGYRDRAIITVNQNSIPSRQRFSAAHELGHWMWDRGKMAFACAEGEMERDWGKDGPERRANRFAADLLLPPRLFQPRAQGQPATFATISALASAFQTSLTATAIRFVELALDPVALVGEEAGVRCWYVLSPPLKPSSREEGPADCEHVAEWLQRQGKVSGPLLSDRRAYGRRSLTLYSWNASGSLRKFQH